MRVAGIMSGTSLDGIDVAIVDIRGQGFRAKFDVVAFSTFPYSAATRRAVLAVSNTNCHTREIARLNFALAKLYADAVRSTCRAHRIALDSLELVGCHGQTIYHEDGVCTLQIGDGSVLAELLGKPVVSDFRPRDMAAGGKGAPLAPYFDYLYFRHAKRGRVLLNLGGIGNLTAIPPGAAPEQVVAFDTGPGNMVIDQLTALHTKGRQSFDRDGRLAQQGRVDRALVDRLLRDRYFQRKPPKTAGRENYGAEFIADLQATGASALDLIATATAFTAATVADQIARFVRPLMPVDDLIVGGGGARNPVLMAYLSAFVADARVDSTQGYGIDPDAKEAVIFAVLAHESHHGRTGNLPSATGARRAVVLGKVSR
jgi:anhydro-N-acetylmuramic acid kinase